MLHLKNFSLLSPTIQSSDVLKAIKIAIPATAIEEAIANTEADEERKRSLPAQLVVSLVIAMSLWSKDSMRDVLKNLVDGLSEAWVKLGKYWHIRVQISNYSSPTAIRAKGDESVILSLGTTNGNHRNFGSLSQWTANCGN